MLNYIIRPEGLFLLGTMQSLLPYLTWLIYGINPNYEYKVGYVPALIYVVGFISFVIGCGFADKPKLKPNYFDNIGTWHSFIVYCLYFLFMINCVQIVALMRVYGCIPLFSFSSGELSITEADELLEDSGMGQVAFLLIGLNLLAGFYLIYLIERIQTLRFKFFSFINIATGIIFLFGLTMGGKRQGIVITLFFIVVGLSSVYRDKLEVLLMQLVSRFKSFRIAYILAVIVTVYIGFEFIGKMRSGRDVTFLNKIEALYYLEWPLINLEYQTELASIGPHKFAPECLLRTLLPKRFTENLNFEKPAKLEVTSPSGFYGELHWFTGLPGIISFAMFSGYISNIAFLRTRNHPFWLFTYCQISWPLFSCHTYNHFLNLTFVPLPVIVYFIVCFTFFPYHRNRYIVPQASCVQKQKLRHTCTR